MTTKWADFLISAVVYDSKHRILYAKQHKDTGESITEGILTDRNTIASNITNGLSYVTIFSSNSTWKKGTNLRAYRIGGEYFIRTDGNKVKLDNLGQLPELEIPKGFSKTAPQPEPAKEQIKKPEPAPPTSPRGSLPKGYSKTAPQPEIQDEATPEQVARLEELEKQITELENLRNSPKITSTVETESKIDIEIEQQISRLSEIESKVKKIEEIQTTEDSDLISDGEIKEYNEKLSKLNNQIKELEKAIRKTHKNHDNEEQSQKIEVDCVKCKTKREIKDAKQTLMKNNKPAIRGTCPECGSKVFRIGKLSKS
jgi:uncharacterized phage infection (PIP) family protein YhgE